MAEQLGTHTLLVKFFVFEYIESAGSNFLGQLILLCPFNIYNLCLCSSIRNCIAYANDSNIVNKYVLFTGRLGMLWGFGHNDTLDELQFLYLLPWSLVAKRRERTNPLWLHWT